MAKRSKEIWIIGFSSPDPSHEGINAYPSREAAIKQAIVFIGYGAREELDGVDWSEGDEAPELLRAILEAIRVKKYDDAIYSWLEFQQEYDPQDQISLGPSGLVSPIPSDFLMATGRHPEK